MFSAGYQKMRQTHTQVSSAALDVAQILESFDAHPQNTIIWGFGLGNLA